MGVVELTEDGDILHIRDNIATCTFFGLEPGGTRYRLASSIGATSEALKLWTEHYRRSAATGQPQCFEFAAAEHDEVRTWLVAVRALYAVPSARRRFMYVAEEVTERKRAERGRLQAEKRLAAVLREREEREATLAGRIRELDDAAAAMSGAKDDFIATLARELGNPLAPILNAIQILQTRSSPDPQLSWVRDVVYRQVRHMAWLLEDLLDASRVGRGKLELRRERVELGAVIELAIETTRPLFDAEGHELHVELPKEGVRIDADPVRLAQIVSNLLGNAAKFTPRGGRVELLVELLPSDLVIRVRDAGIGIAKESLPKIFELFGQASPSKGRVQGGLGLGLALVRGLVQLHGGTVKAYSDGPGKGSEFVVTLPVSERASSTEDSAALDSVHSKHRVLVVDDNRDGADTLAALLTMLGCEVNVAYGGKQALELSEVFRPAVVLLAIGMPGTSGFEVAQRLRETPWGRDVFLVAATAWDDEADRRRMNAVGFDEHLVKPVDIAVLHRLLNGLRTSGYSKKT
jgi:signal transduction histidine kinase/CheY-like chemotaxis protein